MNNILCLGDFSSGKSSFLNMLLGVSILPEQLQSTNLPVIKIHAGETAGIFVREKGQKYGRPIASWLKIPTDWSTFEYIELTVPNHPLLDKGLVLWDSPGVNSTNEQHIKHLEVFLQNYKNRFHSVFYFLHGNLQNTHIDFIKQWTVIQNKLSIVVNIKEVRPESESRKIENQVKKDVRVRLGAIPVELLYIGDLYDEFAAESDKKTKGFGDQQRIALWEDIAIDFETLKKKHEQTIIGDVIFDILKDITGNSVEIEDYKILDIETLKELAEQDDEKALEELIDKYTDLEDYDSALPWMYKGVEKGNSFSEGFLGISYALGMGIKQDSLEGFKWSKKSAEKGNSSGELGLGICYGEGIGVKKDSLEAFKWIKKSADQGNKDGEFYVAAYYENGIGVKKDSLEAFKWYKKSADHGSFTSEWRMGRYYQKGEVVKQDHFEAFKWYMKSAEHGTNYLSENNIGECYEFGLGVKEDSFEAFQWYKKSAEKGYAKGEYNLGLCYEDGKGVTQDYDEAFQWYKKSAEQGFADSEYRLGFLFYEGKGVTQDYFEAVRWFRKSAEQENSDAQWNLGMCYFNGLGVNKDHVEAFRLYKKSADQDDSMGAYALGYMYINGFGVKKNKKEAIYWYKKSYSIDGSDEACEELKKLGVNV